MAGTLSIGWITSTGIKLYSVFAASLPSIRGLIRSRVSRFNDQADNSKALPAFCFNYQASRTASQPVSSDCIDSRSTAPPMQPCQLQKHVLESLDLPRISKYASYESPEV